MDNRKIGVFDSGLGGLTVVRELKKELPGESLVYFGDIARLPYGSKSKENIIEYSHQIIRFLIEQDVKAVIIACGTASSNALAEMQAAYDLPIMGVLEPGAREAARQTRNKKVGVIGTQATIRSGEYARLLKQNDPDIRTYPTACPLFVPLVESGWFEDSITDQVVARYLQAIKEQQVDTLILGCTHYPLLRNAIQREMGEEVVLINPSLSVALEMKEFLTRTDSLSTAEKGEYRFYVTDSPKEFEHLAIRILDTPMMPVQKVSLDKK